jgi:hypothetical protein
MMTPARDQFCAAGAAWTERTMTQPRNAAAARGKMPRVRAYRGRLKTRVRSYRGRLKTRRR